MKLPRFRAAHRELYLPGDAGAGPALVRYLAAALVVAAAFGVRLLLVPITGTGAPYVVFFAAVLLASLYAGLGPGLFATALAAPLAAYVFVARAGYTVVEAAGQALLFTIDGVLVAYFSHLITRSRRAADAAADALRRSEEALRKADQRKDEFLAMLSHELRNPLAAIRNSAYLLTQPAHDALADKRAREVIDRQSTQLTRLVDDLLDVTRIARGKLQLRHEPVELGALVRGAVEDQRGLFEDRGLVLEYHLPDAPIWIDGDSARVVQVVHNLLSNAAKFTRAGGRVDVALDRDGDAARLRVRDSGVGIAAEDLSRVFEPFVQLAPAGTSAAGLGLGLALVKGIVEQHGGTVDASSSAVGGAEFVVRLPLRSAPAEPTPERGEAPPRASVRRHRVLVIEDTPDVAHALARLLTLLNQDVRVAADGASGIAIAKEFRPDVVLCDIALPGPDGYEIARRLRADRELRAAMLVALTGYVQPEDRRRAIEVGFVQHLAKPATVADLQRVLEAASCGSNGSSLPLPSAEPPLALS